MAAVSGDADCFRGGGADLNLKVGIYMGMLKNVARNIFYKLPVSIQEAYRHPGLINQIKELQILEQKTYCERRMYQLKRVQHLLAYAYEHTQYYRNLFDKHNIKPWDVQSLDDMKKIPVLTKDIVRDNLQDMISDVIPKDKLIYVTTGGSTGKPLGFYISKEVDTKRLAFEWLHWNRMGYNMGDSCVILRGRVLPEGQWFAYEEENNFLVLSTFLMKEELLPKYIAKIDEFSPVVIQAYPSAITILAKYMLDNGVSLRNPIKAVSTSSEILYKEQKMLIEKAFQAPVYDKYGNCEQVGVIGMQDDGYYHEFMEHSYLEFINDDSQDAHSGEYARIIGTSLINDVVPFIRYETGDMVKLSDDFGSKICSGDNSGPSTLIDSIQGRCSGDVMVTKYGNLVSVTGMNTHSDIFDHVKRIQYYQDTKGIVVLKLVKTDDYSEKDEAKIISELQTKFQHQVDLRIEYVDDISRTARGKYLYLDQRLKGLK